MSTGRASINPAKHRIVGHEHAMVEADDRDVEACPESHDLAESGLAPSVMTPEDSWSGIYLSLAGLASERNRSQPLAELRMAFSLLKSGAFQEDTATSWLATCYLSRTSRRYEVRMHYLSTA
jgi:hypothetical protein